VKRIAIMCIRAYQIAVSPFLPNSCIYTPSCSQYALEAVCRHGFWRGAWCAARRLVRCGPWSAGGADPVK
jgi:putative membrane protein insertion efficiency factor